MIKVHIYKQAMKIEVAFNGFFYCHGVPGRLHDARQQKIIEKSSMESSPIFIIEKLEKSFILEKNWSFKKIFYFGKKN